MVCSALIRSCILRNFFLCNCRPTSCNLWHKPDDLEARRTRRQKEWSIWLNSISDDIDLAADWWFFYDVFQSRDGGLLEDRLLLALLATCIFGTITWFLEFVMVACIRPQRPWWWLPLLTILVEDIPQLTLTLMIRDVFNKPDGLAVFNIMTSLYAILIRLSQEIFLEWCYCIEPLRAVDDENAPEEDDDNDDYIPGSRAIAYGP